jgi:hypothetical protein
MILFDGPVDAVSTIGSPESLQVRMQRQSLQWWWPKDRAWFVGTGIDHPWTYVAGRRSLIDHLVAAGRWETVEVEPSDRW